MKPTLLRSGHPFDDAELASMVSDGVVRRVLRDVHTSMDPVDPRWLRSQAAALLIPDAIRQRGTVYLQLAAWIHDGGPEPIHLDVLLHTRQRAARSWSDAGLRLHETERDLDDVVDFDGLKVRSLPGTIVDLAQFGVSEAEMMHLDRLVASCSAADLARAQELLAVMPRRPGRKRAQQRLNELVGEFRTDAASTFAHDQR